MNHELSFIISIDDIFNKLSSSDREKIKYMKFTKATLTDKSIYVTCFLSEESIKEDEYITLLSSIPDGYLSLN